MPNTYYLESHDLERLETVASKLLGGSDENRDLGNIMDAILSQVRFSPVDPLDDPGH